MNFTGKIQRPSRRIPVQELGISHRSDILRPMIQGATDRSIAKGFEQLSPVNVVRPRIQNRITERGFEMLASVDSVRPTTRIVQPRTFGGYFDTFDSYQAYAATTNVYQNGLFLPQVAMWQLAKFWTNNAFKPALYGPKTPADWVPAARDTTLTLAEGAAVLRTAHSQLPTDVAGRLAYFDRERIHGVAAPFNEMAYLDTLCKMVQIYRLDPGTNTNRWTAETKNYPPSWNLSTIWSNPNVKVQFYDVLYRIFTGTPIRRGAANISDYEYGELWFNKAFSNKYGSIIPVQVSGNNNFSLWHTLLTAAYYAQLDVQATVTALELPIDSDWVGASGVLVTPPFTQWTGDLTGLEISRFPILADIYNRINAATLQANNTTSAASRATIAGQIRDMSAQLTSEVAKVRALRTTATGIPQLTVPTLEALTPQLTIAERQNADLNTLYRQLTERVAQVNLVSNIEARNAILAEIDLAARRVGDFATAIVASRSMIDSDGHTISPTETYIVSGNPPVSPPLVTTTTPTPTTGEAPVLTGGLDPLPVNQVYHFTAVTLPSLAQLASDLSETERHSSAILSRYTNIENKVTEVNADATMSFHNAKVAELQALLTDFQSVKNQIIAQRVSTSITTPTTTYVEPVAITPPVTTPPAVTTTGSGYVSSLADVFGYTTPQLGTGQSVNNFSIPSGASDTLPVAASEPPKSTGNSTGMLLVVAAVAGVVLLSMKKKTK